MAGLAEADGGGRRINWRAIGWSAAAALLLLPLIAMQFNDEVAWTGADFLFAAVLIGGTGLALEGAARISRDRYYRAGVAVALAASVLLIWVNGAVGIIGDEDNPLNLLYAAVLAAALAGALIARFRPAGMARAMAGAAAVQALVSLVALTFDGAYVAMLSAAWVALWLGSAWLFRRAARGQNPPATI